MADSGKETEFGDCPTESPTSMMQSMHPGPRRTGPGWTMYLWLAYLAFFFIQPIAGHAGTKQWALTLLAAAIFLYLYLTLFWGQKAYNRKRTLAHIAGMLLLGLIYAPYNPGASTFIIYACALVPFAVDSDALAIKLIVGMVGIVGVEALFLQLPWWYWVYAVGLSIVVGAGNVYYAQRNRSLSKLRMAHEEIEQLAKVAERERIARDLHDVLGHTLSMVILKSELAGKLMDRDPARAGSEIREVEQIARTALSDVREAIRGYRSRGLTAEFAMAKATLETAGIAVQCDTPSVHIPPLQESVLSLAVREAVTNVVRHSQAHRCRLELAQQNGTCRLEIQDDGRGGSGEEGSGLRGMRERVEMLGGTLIRSNETGTTLVITLPLDKPATEEAGA